ncbi:XK-related protein 6 [Trichonephila inaurata madagascariensis]|uniref:XK-related protein n=1 Tax=Trichonephila inaurata madagascariensis TaxID=2747483 RepID=A0A8X6INE0_9ARAC|nr:XK-related protein 6 [Trichonephila inaurata madagascariensis]
MDIFFIILSIGSFVADIGTDLMVMFQYYKNGHFLWLILTAILVCLPSLIVQIFSIRWYINDGKVTNHIWIIHILQLGLFYRFLQLLLEGLRVRKSTSDLEKFNCQQSDICMLRLFESFTESAPQLVLQLYIMVSTDDWNLWTGISAVACIISLSWGIAAYSKAMRNLRLDKEKLSWWGLLFQSMWRIGMVSARIISMVLFAVIYGHWLFIGIGLHWLIMIMWIFYQKTDFCTTWWEERLYNCVVGVIYCFCYFNIKDGKARYRMTIYYFTTVLENICVILAFYFSETYSHNFRDLMALLVPAGMLIGLVCMLLYYRFFHPSGPIIIFTGKQSKIKNDDIREDKLEIKPNFCTLKTCRKFIEVTDENNENDTALSEAPFNDDMEKNVNISNVSLTFKDKSVFCFKRNLHRSHSFNCSAILFDNQNFQFFRRRKLLASHYRNVNYNFRPAVAFGILSSKIHCSCLILPQEQKQFDMSTVEVNEKLSSSLPNLELSFETEQNSSLESTDLNKKTFFSHIMNSSSSYSDIYEPPIINKDDIIRIKVVGNIV